MKTLRLLTFAALTTTLSAQVVVTEVHPGAGWIEIQNRNDTTAALGGWTVYCTTATAGQPNNYWWAFPSATSLEAGAFLRVHWFAPYQAPTATDVYTGNNAINFLFGLGGEALRENIGSVALLSSQDGAMMGTPAIYQDWITWGEGNRPREEYAVQNNRWIDGHFVASPGATSSIALGADPAAEPSLVADFFIDSTPSPLAPNQDGAVVAHYGHGCAVGFMNEPSLNTLGIPAIGNGDFGIRANGTNGLSGQVVVFLFGFAQTDGIVLPLPNLTCPIWVDGGIVPLMSVVMPAQNGLPYTDLPLSLSEMTSESIGWTVYVQALVGVMPFTSFDHAASGGLAVTFGG